MKMKKIHSPESGANLFPSSQHLSQDASSCVIEIDHFIKTLATIRSQGFGDNIIGPIISNYASKWLPELSPDSSKSFRSLLEKPSSRKTIADSLKRKIFLVETVIGILPPEKGSVHCDFLLKLLRTASFVGLGSKYRTELENQISRCLDEASLKELMIPSFSHTCETLLDVGLVIRLVERFVSLDESTKRDESAIVRVASLVDAYLAEAAVDSNFWLPEFAKLVEALPDYARATHDGLYRAVDTFLKSHPRVTKAEKKVICSVLDAQKLSTAASFHAAHNERLPLRFLIQLLYSERTKTPTECSRLLHHRTSKFAPAPRMSIVSQQQHGEVVKLREDVTALRRRCSAMQGQIDKLSEKKRSGFLWWRRGSFGSGEKKIGVEEEGGIRRASPRKMWRKSL